MKKAFYIISLVLIICSCKKNVDQAISAPKENVLLDSVSKAKFIRENKNINYDSFYKKAKQYCRQNNLNQDKFILIDLDIHSGLKRFFIYDFKKNKILKSFMVSHGCGNSAWGETYTKENTQISNEIDSHCSSTGKYIVLNRGVSQWGIKVNYVLQGKDKTNSNAINRAIVLHSWEAVPNDEAYPDGTPEGWGCPAVSNEGMKEIDEILKENKKVLFWVIKSK